ncbi:hypothetical protein [Chryseobacterium camelliae]|uniref:hypothetical protein n=1 Tax=Chryseobacterium camelliae TaxID=1265445 RepID=UPI0012FD8A99|nr:hypothetical protein [Chryseobacterium camelliae]MDR6516855.1 hypothetical protein [Chryseobacterium camelliae]
MKKLVLLMAVAGLFAVSCKKQEVQNDNNTMSDSMSTGSMSDSAGTMNTMPMDTTATVRDSSMNQNNTSPQGSQGAQGTQGTQGTQGQGSQGSQGGAQGAQNGRATQNSTTNAANSAPTASESGTR